MIRLPTTDVCDCRFQCAECIACTLSFLVFWAQVCLIKSFIFICLSICFLHQQDDVTSRGGASPFMFRMLMKSCEPRPSYEEEYAKVISNHRASCKHLGLPPEYTRDQHTFKGAVN